MQKHSKSKDNVCFNIWMPSSIQQAIELLNEMNILVIHWTRNTWWVAMPTFHPFRSKFYFPCNHFHYYAKLNLYLDMALLHLATSWFFHMVLFLVLCESITFTWKYDPCSLISTQHKAVKHNTAVWSEMNCMPWAHSLNPTWTFLLA